MGNGSPSMASILEGVKNKDRIAQKLLYEAYYSFAKNICLHHSSSEQEAVEILNDGFLKVFTHIEMYDDTYSFKTWLRKIMINKSIDYFRKYHKIKITDIEQVDPVIFSAEEINQFDHIEDLIPYLRKLSPQYRLVLNLHVVEDYSHDEIARKLNISPGTSRSNLFRAIENLRKLMNINTNQSVIKN